MAIHEEIALKIYRNMVRHRALDEQMIINFRKGGMASGWHSGIGEEAIAAPTSLLNREDYAWYTHRAAYVWLAKGMSMKEIIAEFYGRATGCAKGKGGTHIVKPSLGILGRAGSQGGHFVLAVGTGLAAKRKGQGQVVIMHFGDGCGCRGTLHESFNFASVHKLPILWINENNGFSVSVPQTKTWAIKDIAQIANGYAMPGRTVDGNDVVAVTETAQEFIDRARKGQGPALMEMKTYRLRAHNEGTSTAYMAKEDIEAWRKKDPIMRFEQVLLKQGVLREQDVQKIKTDAEAEVQEAQKFSDESPNPSPEEAFTDLYATSHS